MESGEDFYDYSTISGAFRSCIRRSEWKFLLGTVGLFIFCVLMALTISAPDQRGLLMKTKSNLQLLPTITFEKEIFKFEGNPNNFSILSGISNASDATVSVVRVTNAAIEASSFSDSLKPHSSTIRELYLENVTLVGEFNRIHLPNLAVFVLRLVIPESEWDRMEPYQDASQIHSYFFFNLNEGQDWPISEVSNLGVEILYEVHGFEFFRVNKTNEELILYVPFCDEILRNTKTVIRILSVSSCSLSKASVPDKLKYLNFFDVDVSDGEIGDILRVATTLRHAFLDIQNKTLDVSELPSSLQTLSIGGINLTNENPNAVPALPRLDTLSLSFNRVTENVYKHFNTIFPNLQQVAAIGWQVANSKFIKTILDSRTQVIIVEEFDRNLTSTTDAETEKRLADFGVRETEENFMLILPTYGDNYIGFPMTSPVGHAYRYSLLGWYKFLSVPAYSMAEKYQIRI